MRPLRLALLPLGIALGLVGEWASYEAGELPLVTADFVVGCILLAGGLVAWERRSESRVGPLMMLAGFTWFLGTLFEPALYLHRGPLVHLHLSYPTGRLPTRLSRVVVVAAYIDAAVEPLAQNDLLTVGLSVAVALTAFQVFLGTSGPARKAGGPALAAALAFAGVLALGALERLVGEGSDRTVLWIYDGVIACVAVLLVVDLLRGRWADAVVTGLVVDLGTPQEAGTLRAKLARALGDPGLVVGYRLPGTADFVDEAGRPLESPGSGKAETPIEDRGEQIAVLVHDEGLLADRKLVRAVAAAARIAMANAGLQAEARARADELEASRRRIVEAADAQRRRLEQELRLGAERRLESVHALLADARSGASRNDAAAIGALDDELGATRRELREFAYGVHPAVLTEGGLMPALTLLTERSTIPVVLRGEVTRLPAPVEAALFFVCSEALTNAAKHAEASHIRIEVGIRDERATLVVDDDGIGGADISRGSGLRGLADRVEALGGRLRVESPAGARAGTRVIAEIPTRQVSERA